MDYDVAAEEAVERGQRICSEHGTAECPCDAAAAAESRQGLVDEVLGQLTLVPVDPVEAELRFGQAVLPGVEGAAEADRAAALAGVVVGRLELRPISQAARRGGR